MTQMKKGKVSSSSGAVTKKLKASLDACFKTILDLPNFISDLPNFIFCDNAMPCKCNVNVIISLFKGNSETLDRLIMISI